jgi:hypothetical protein
MKTLLLFLLLLLLLSPVLSEAQSGDDSSVALIGFKWAKTRQTMEKLDPTGVSPNRMVFAGNKNFERNARINNPMGARDPYEDTVDGRAAALEKSVQQARAPQPKTIEGFEYRAKIQNTGQKVVQIVFWEYQFTEKANPSAMTRRQFLCAVNIKPEKDKELLAFSLSGPSDVISVASLSNKPANLFDEKVVINRVEYADGSIWQRKDWNFAEISAGFARAIGTPWGSEMCRGL